MTELWSHQHLCCDDHQLYVAAVTLARVEAIRSQYYVVELGGLCGKAPSTSRGVSRIAEATARNCAEQDNERTRCPHRINDAIYGGKCLT
jgi:hypothetical protein